MSAGAPRETRVLVTEPLSAVGLEELRAHFEVDYRPECTEEELGEALASAQALIVRSKTRVTGDRIRAARSLRVIGRAGVGYDNIDLEAATERGILVMNVPDANTMAATEHTFALILAMMRRIPQAVQSMREGKWTRSQLVGNELYEKTLGIVGFGRIGKEIAHRAQAFGMEVLVFDPYVTQEKADALRVGLAGLDTLLERSDAITLHVPLTENTRKMIGREQLARMKPTAYLVNCARGGIIDDEALLDALREKKIAGAALDVYSKEPPDFSTPLLSAQLPNLICTPHLGASTEEAQEKVGTSIARQVTSALVNEEFANSVNLPLIDPNELTR
ncbi:MAG: phosphoglycerate dehydrogenase, partial [Candidatus Wallbacteria bacterium]|nr:phosphoglycerate dehydrogenase [Candidatus Wallbacteria bacterium]